MLYEEFTEGLATGAVRVIVGETTFTHTFSSLFMFIYAPPKCGNSSYSGSDPTHKKIPLR